MALAPLISTSDLAERGITTGESEVGVFIDVASTAVRQAAGSSISEQTSTVALAGFDGGNWLNLPGRPVTSVDSVTLDGEEITDFKLAEGRLWRHRGWGSHRRGEPSTIEVTYTHGLPTVPEHIVDLVCSMVAAGLSAARADEDGLGLAVDNGRVQSVSIDGFTESYATSADAVSAVTQMTLPPATRLWLAQQFGGGADVVASR